VAHKTSLTLSHVIEVSVSRQASEQSCICVLQVLIIYKAKCDIVQQDIISNGGVMVSMLASSGVDRGFEPRSDQIKDYKIGICCFSTKHAALRRKSKDWLVQNQDNVSEWGDVSYLADCCFTHSKKFVMK
jgi:hypothetical protein